MPKLVQKKIAIYQWGYTAEGTISRWGILRKEYRQRVLSLSSRFATMIWRQGVCHRRSTYQWLRTRVKAYFPAFWHTSCI